ncbi:MAG: PolC-type DNA polymerase III N-terminal domain-containing protein [Bacilli bacterium]
MQDKMEILLKQIKLNDSDCHYFNGAFLTRIVGNKDKDNYKFLITLDTNLPVNIYDVFNCSLIKAFPTIKTVTAIFDVKNVNTDLIKDYLHYFMQMIIKERPLIGLISDDAIVITDKQIDILVANKAEERQILDIKDVLLEKFIKAGYADLNISIVIDSNLNVNINKEITEAMQPNIVLPKEPVVVPKAEEKEE